MGYLVQLKYKLRAFKILCQRVIAVLGEALRRDLQEGIDSLDQGEGTPLNMNDIKAKARAIKESQT